LSKPFFVGDLPDLINKDLGRTGSPKPALPSHPVNAPPSNTTPAPSKTEEKDVSTALPLAAEPIQSEPPPQAICAVPPETISFLRANEAEILRLLGDLNREVRAEAILLIVGQELIAQAGLLSREKCRELAILVAQSSQAAAQAANFLGEPGKRFAQSLHEGQEYRVYTLTLNEGVLLSLALSSNVPLGMIRHQCRQIGEQISKFM